MPRRKIPRNYRSETGRFPSIINGRSVAYESSLERDYFHWLEFEDDVLSYEEQPLHITKKKGRKTIQHYPDCRVCYKEASGRKPMIVEVKYKKELEKKEEKLEEKLAMTKEFARENGEDFTVITEDDIRGVYLENLKFIYKYAKPYPAFHQHKAFILENKVVDGPLKVSELLSTLTTDRLRQAELLRAIWHMVFTKEVAIDLHEKVTMDSIVEIRCSA